LHGGVIFLCIKRHAAEGFEGIVCEDVDATVIGFEVINLLSEEERPEIFAQKFDAVERCCWSRCVSGESVSNVSNDLESLSMTCGTDVPFNHTQSDPVPQVL
jgi:hypothetical protein